jgi:hypothetical protein
MTSSVTGELLIASGATTCAAALEFEPFAGADSDGRDAQPMAP